jgi:hypothetical protein
MLGEYGLHSESLLANDYARLIARLMADYLPT